MLRRLLLLPSRLLHAAQQRLLQRHLLQQQVQQVPREYRDPRVNGRYSLCMFCSSSSCCSRNSCSSSCCSRNSCSSSCRYTAQSAVTLQYSIAGSSSSSSRRAAAVCTLQSLRLAWHSLMDVSSSVAAVAGAAVAAAVVSSCCFRSPVVGREMRALCRDLPKTGCRCCCCCCWGRCRRCCCCCSVGLGTVIGRVDRDTTMRRSSAAVAATTCIGEEQQISY